LKEKAVRNLGSEVLSRSLVVKRTLQITEKREKRETVKLKLDLPKLSKKPKQVQQKKKRKRSGEKFKPREKGDYTCSKCGPFKALCLPKNKKAVHHYCGSFPKIITYTLGKIHRTHGRLVLRGVFSKRQMDLYLEKRLLSQKKVKRKKRRRRY